MTAAPTVAGVIEVVEQTPEWLPELRRQFAGTAVQVLPGCDPSLPAASPGRPQVVVVSGLGEFLHWRQTSPARLRSPDFARVIAILSTDERDCEFALRDLGVVSILDAFCGGAQLAHTCERWLQDLPT